ncbi:MAG TPA: hypothetical protein VD789_07895 [Thermomicrobiales bacterium]|nr:hypothetical protein [Thermomicrobiales bacterium]
MSSEHDVSGKPFHVDQHESLPEVLERLHGHRGESLTLVIADHSPILLTATEFRALKDLADRQHIRLRVETDDTLRRQLATMFGLAKPHARAASEAVGDDTHAQGFGSWRNARRPKHRPAGQPPEADEPPVERARREEPADPIAVSRRRRNSLYADSVANDKPDDDIILIDDAGLDYIEDDEDGGRHSRAWLFGRIAAVALVAIAIVLAVLWYWFPAVEVDITLREAEVSTGIVYSVAAPGAQIPSDASFAVEASQQSAEVPFTIEIPASGVVREPDGTASGPLLFRNVADAPVTLEQGTELTTIAGSRYLLLDTVEVPAGNVDDPGEVEGMVTAAEAGSGGNLGVGQLTGKVPDQNVFYSNLTGPIEGGSDREFPVVTEEDLAAAELAVQEDLRSAAAEGWLTQLPEGMAIVGPSVSPGDPTYSIEGAAGDQRESVVVSGTVPVSGYVYDLAEVERQARSTFEVALQDQVPPGYELIASTIQLGEPEVLAEAPENVEYQVSATADVRAIFDDGAQDGLRERMAGSSVDDARTAISEVGAIESWEMSQSPDWWPDRMPQSDGRITLDIQDSLDDTGDGGGPASPASSPVVEGGS